MNSFSDVLKRLEELEERMERIEVMLSLPSTSDRREPEDYEFTAHMDNHPTALPPPLPTRTFWRRLLYKLNQSWIFQRRRVA